MRFDLDHTSAISQAAYGRYLGRRGESDRAAGHFRAAVELAPLSREIRKFLADALFLTRDYQESLRAADAGLQLHPECWLMHMSVARASIALGDYPRAVRHYRRAIVLEPQRKPAILAEIAHAHAGAGATGKALRCLEQIRQIVNSGWYISPVAIARVHATLGNIDQAVQLVEEACAKKDTLEVLAKFAKTLFSAVLRATAFCKPNKTRKRHFGRDRFLRKLANIASTSLVSWLKQDSRLDRLRSDRRCQAILAEIGL